MLTEILRALVTSLVCCIWVINSIWTVVLALQLNQTHLILSQVFSLLLCLVFSVMKNSVSDWQIKYKRSFTGSSSPHQSLSNVWYALQDLHGHYLQTDEINLILKPRREKDFLLNSVDQVL